MVLLLFKFLLFLFCDIELDGINVEPDLALIFGPYLSYFGYQPWNVRLTEFM